MTGVPPIAQQRRSIRHTLAATVVPSIDPGASFAQEQAGLILATLDWMLDVQASEHRYEQVELADARALLAALTVLQGGEPEPQPDEPPADLETLRAAVLEVKQRAERAFTALSTTDAADDAWRTMSAAARRQVERELSWARMTGFPKSPERIDAVLERQSADPARTSAS